MESEKEIINRLKKLIRLYIRKGEPLEELKRSFKPAIFKEAYIQALNIFEDEVKNEK